MPQAGLAFSQAVFMNVALNSLQAKSRVNKGLDVTVTDSNADARVIYGETRVSGVNIIPPVTSNTDVVAAGKQGDRLHQVLAIALHEIDSFIEVYFDQDVLPTPDPVTGNIGSGKYEDVANVFLYRGTMTQDVDWRLNTDFPTEWLTTARGRGVAYVHACFDWDKGKAYRGVPEVSVLVRGARCYDPRLDSTNGGSGSHRYNDSTTWEWTSNPALCWANFRISAYGYENDPATEINWTSVADAADVCDTLVDDGLGGSQKRYTCNGMLVISKDSLQPNERMIIEAMLGKRRYVGGKWEIIAGCWKAPSWTIAKADWNTIDRIKPFRNARQGRVSLVHCFYTSPDRNWQRVECYRRSNATYLDDDAGELGEADIEQQLCTDESEAQRKAEFVLRQSRNGIIVTGTLPPRFQKMPIFDTVAVTFEELGWVSKTFRISTMAFKIDGSVQVALVEEQEADWDDLDDAEYFAPSLCQIPDVNPTYPSAPQSLSIRSTAGILEASWDSPLVVPRGTRYRLLVSAVSCSDPSSASTVWEGDALRTQVQFLNPSSLHWCWAQAYLGSYYSYFEPNTYGIVGVPGFSAQMSGSKVIPDGQFRSGLAIGSYWQGNLTLPVSLSPTGGATDGCGKIICVGSTEYNADANWFRTLYSVRSPVGRGEVTNSDLFAEVHPGQWIRWTALARRTTTLAGSGGGQGGFGVLFSLIRTESTAPFGLDVGSTFCRLDDQSSGQWVTFLGSCQVPTSAAWEFVTPSLRFSKLAQSSGTLEIGRFDAYLG